MAMWQVIGQSKAVELLRRSLESERLSHAYLFVGQPHVGKTTLAINLAQALNCEQEARPCGQCRSCLHIAAGNHPDVQLIGRLPGTEPGEAGIKKEISIAQIKEIQRSAGLQPYEGRHRVFIIDGAEYLNEDSANCLLKTLEEPPPKVLFILLTVNDGRLLPTIVSRCQRVELFPLPASVIEQALIEQWQVAPEKARVLSRLCRGSIGWAVSASRDESLVQERSQRLDELLGLNNASLDQRFAFAARLAAQFSKSRDSVEEALELWLGWWRDVLLTREECTQFIINIDRETVLRSHAECYSLAGIRGFMEAIREAVVQLGQNANPRLVLEVLMLSIPNKGEKKDKVPQRLGSSG
jgi:DNA polymerase-3 subunit delta'